MKKVFSFYLVIITAYLPAQAQIKTGKNFYQVSREFNNFYNTAGKRGHSYKQFKRWEWYYKTRLGPGGTLVDNTKLNIEALRNSPVNRSANSTTPLANTGSWTALGPNSVTSDNHGIGRVNRIAFHPTDANTMYLASATGGLWITNDNGANWFSYSEGIPNMSLSGVAVHPTNPSIIYILTGDGDATFGGSWAQFRYTKYSTGVLRSGDGGFTWHHTGLHWPETDERVAYKLVMHPTNPNILMVATDEGLWRTADGGSTWNQVVTGIWFWDIEFHPTNPSIVYASGNNSTETRIYRSTNSGATFTETDDLNLTSNSWNRTALAVTPANPDYVYLLAGPSTSTGNFRGFYRSTNSADTFLLRTATPNILGRSASGNDNVDQERYDLCLAVSPTNSSTIVTGGIRVWTSSNAGSTFSYQDNYVNATSYYHDDIHDLAYHPLRSNELYMCADGGLYRSTDNGNNWISMHNNLQVTQYYKMAINPVSGLGNENIVIGGTQDNGTNKRGSGGGSSFTQILGADGMDCFIDPDGVNTYVMSIQDGEFYYSTNAGSSNEYVCTPASADAAIGYAGTITGNWVTPVAEITGNTTQFVIGYDPVVKVTRVSAGVYSFVDAGDGPGGTSVSGRTFIKTARGNANRMYAGDNDNNGNDDNSVHVTTDGGSNWTNILNEVNHNGIPVTDLTFNADNGNEIWITFGGYSANKKVWYSSNNGANWTNVTGSLPNVPVNCIVYDDNNGNPGGAVYIGTDIGVFYRDNNLGDWIPFSNNLPVVEITDLEIHETEGLLRAATYGRGIWQTTLYSSCPANVTLNTSNTAMFKPYYFQASSSVVSSAVHYGAGAYVYYKAGTELRLDPGFNASGSTDNEFKAEVGPCSGGVPTRTGTQTNLRGFLFD